MKRTMISLFIVLTLFWTTFWEETKVITSWDVIKEANSWNEDVKRLEDKLNEVKQEIDSKLNQWEAVESIIADLNEKLSVLWEKINKIEVSSWTKDLANSILEKETLKVELNKLKNERTKLNEDLTYYKDLQNKFEKENLEKEKILSLYTEMKSNLDREKAEEIWQKLKTYFYFIIWLSILWFLLLVLHRHKKDKVREIRLNVIASFTMVLSLMLLFFYIKPSAIVYLVFVASALILIFKDLILSFISSVFVISRYKIWDIVELKWEWLKWKIISISLVNTELLSVDDKFNFENEHLKIPNNYFLLNKISMLSSNWIVNDSISFSVNQNTDLENLTNRIEETLEKKVWHSLKNLSLSTNSKFKKLIRLKDSENLITYQWNDTIENNLKIKEWMLKTLLEFRVLKDIFKWEEEKKINENKQVEENIKLTN